jgi:hypothetical protein
MTVTTGFGAGRPGTTGASTVGLCAASTGTAAAAPRATGTVVTIVVTVGTAAAAMPPITVTVVLILIVAAVRYPHELTGGSGTAVCIGTKRHG